MTETLVAASPADAKEPLVVWLKIRSGQFTFENEMPLAILRGQALILRNCGERWEIARFSP